LPSTAKADRVRIKAIFRLVLIVMIMIICLPLHLIWRGVRLRSPWPRLFLFAAGYCAGARVKVTGAPIKRNVLFIANHVSWLDIMVVAGKTGCAFVAKAGMAPWPVIGWLATLNNSVYVARDNRHGVQSQAVAIKSALETGQPLTLFPEGTTGNGIDLLAFRSSLIAAVTPPPPGVLIQPVVIDYGPRAPEIAWTDAESVGKNALRIMGLPGTIPVSLQFLTPLNPADFADRKAISAHSRQAIAEILCQTPSQ
jgi:lyso-ornithine lipid O-acyltransferase